MQKLVILSLKNLGLIFIFVFAIENLANAQIIVEVWNGQTLNDPQDMANNPNILGAPTSVTTLTSEFKAQSNRAGNFVARYSACFTPPTNGSYNFWLVADRKAKMWLQVDQPNFVNKAASASSFGSTPPPENAWDYPSQYIPGQRGTQIMNTTRVWCIQAVQIEDNNDNINHLAIGWWRPGSATENYVRQYQRPIPASYFRPPTLPTTISLTTSTSSINTPGQMIGISWTASNTLGCVGTSSPPDSAWNGDKGPSGNTNFILFLPTIFSLSCLNLDGVTYVSSNIGIGANYPIVSPGHFSLNWDANTDPYTIGYHIQARETSVTYGADIIDTGSSTIFQPGSYLFPLTGTYHFVVRAYNANNETGPNSNEVFAYVVIP